MTGPERRGARREPSLSGLAVVLGVAAVGYLFLGLAIPVLLAAGLAYLLNPLVAWAEGLGIRRSAAVAALYAGLAVLGLAGVLLLGPRVRTEMNSLATRLPRLADEIDASLVLAGREIAEAFPEAQRLFPRVESRRGWIDQLTEGWEVRVNHMVQQAGELLLFVILVPFFAYFFLRDTRRLVGGLLDRLPPAHIETTVAVWSEVERITGGYLRGIAMDGLVFGTLAGLGLWALGVPYPLLLGVFAGLANIVPIVGPLLGGGAAGLVALTRGHGLGDVGGVFLLFLLLKVADDTLIQPLTIARSVRLHPALLLGSVVAGGQALGVLGMVIAVPAATVLQETVRLWLEHRRVLSRPVDAAWRPPDPSRFLC